MAALIIATAPSLPLSFIFIIIVMIIIITMLAQSAVFLVSDFRSRLCDEGVGRWVPSAFKNPSVPTEHELFVMAEHHMSILAISLF